MRTRQPGGAGVLSRGALALLTAFQSSSQPKEEFAGIVAAFLSKEFVADWQGVERLPGVKWAALPPVRDPRDLNPGTGGC